MKDDKLEKQFEEYFKGVNIQNDITADAKAYIVPKRRIMPKLLKFASIAASIVLVFAVTLTVMFSANFNRVPPEGNLPNSSPNGDTSHEADSNSPSDSDGPQNAPSNPPGSGSDNNPGVTPPTPPASDNPEGDSRPSAPASPAPDSPDDDWGGGTKFNFYTDDSLDYYDVTAEELSSLHSSLEFIEACESDGAKIENCKSAYMDEKLALIKAQLNKNDGLVFETTRVFVEYTQDNLVYSELSDYYKGSVYYYNNVKYYLKKTVNKGKTQSNLLILYGGVKYYFSIISSNENAHKDYLKLIVK